ncbi:pyruvate:ferredoxin (flavodoxin) oxidoreductase [Nitrosomonas sp. ANs5]|uniref:pyruvate:ferredoxin (flavodoxin) oxidoreductase n=1 Tax=Nitrosomonas sp. ANs5 TaxID=3423941 RepID=UPI003D340AC1
MTTPTRNNRIATIDGNEATAYIAYRVNEVCAIYPITPSSTMAELADEWAAKGIPNIWGNVPEVIEMQSEAGAAGTVHGALQTGALTTTFTASQGLMLMLPNMYKIAGELTPAVFHVAARSLAAQALSIFGDHNDVMAARTTGFALLASASVQEAHDMALICQAATLKARIPFLHFFDGFRTSHEVSKITLLSDEQIRAMMDDELVYAHRYRNLNPDRPVIRGTAQNPDVYFQARETVNPYYLQLPAIVEENMDRFSTLTGRRYQLFEYYGAPDAERVVILMGSGAQTAIETCKHLAGLGEKVGTILVRLYRPLSMQHFLHALPPTARRIAVLDRSKEPGATGEPLYQDVTATLMEAFSEGKIPALPRIVGGRYGLSSKEFTPAMAKAVFDALKQDTPKNHFTIGIRDDLTHSSLEYDPDFVLQDKTMTEALFFGLGADGTVGANKNSIKIIGENTPLHAQGYFVYDSKKSGAKTVSHLRFGKNPILAPYLIKEANFIACHQYNFIEKENILAHARVGACFLLNSPYGPEAIWNELPRPVQQDILDKRVQLFVIDASKVARESGMGHRINTIMQTCFFALSGVLPKDEAISQIKRAIEKTYAKKGKAVIAQNFRAVDAALANLHPVDIPDQVNSRKQIPPAVAADAPQFVREVTAMMMQGKGDELPVSMLPADGTYPSGTTKWEKRNIADEVPAWEPDICIQCGNCSFVCPHSVIRAKFYHGARLAGAPAEFPSAPINAKGFPETRYSLQVYVEDCTGCRLCVEACPAVSLTEPGKKAINMHSKAPVLEREKQHIDFFMQLPVNDRTRIDFSLVRGAQFLEPLFEFSGACAGCGETPYLRLLSQLFGDRLIVANATGCSSIYGGNLPTTPWTTNAQGQGPAWSNSLFEDNAEFGLGMRITVDKHAVIARDLLEKLRPALGDELVDGILHAPQQLESEISRQRERVGLLKVKLLQMTSPDASSLLSVADTLVRRSIWLVGGDGWAYDIGAGGLDHVLASGKNMNVLVLDTEVYSNTGGQMSKATPTAATAKFAAAGKQVGKKDLAMQAISYGNVYVAQIAMGANPQQTLLAMREAEAYPGPSLVLAYSHCIAHGINMAKGLDQQKLAAASGHWPLIRYNPALRQAGKNPFILDSPRPTIKLKDYAYNELRYRILAQSKPDEAEHLLKLAQEIVNLRWKTYEDMASWPSQDFQPIA